MKIKSARDLQLWLTSKPAELSAAFASRIALRVLPLRVEAFEHSGFGQRTRNRMILTLFRAIAITRSACRYPSPGSNRAAARAAAAFATEYAADAARASARAAAAVDAVSAARAAGDAQTAASAGVTNQEKLMLWASVSADCNWLDEAKKSTEAFLAGPLWRTASDQPNPFEVSVFLGWPDNPDSWGKWGNWIKWYDLRLKGASSEWGLPPKQEAEMARRLIDSEEWFWKHGGENPEWLNGQIDEWLAELRDAAEALEPPPVNESDGTSAELLPEQLDQIASHFASPKIVISTSNKLAAVPNPKVDMARDVRSFSTLVSEMLVLLPPTYSSLGRNTPKLLKANLRTYKAELKANRSAACWGALDRLIASGELCFAASEPEMFGPGLSEQLQQVFTLHQKCMDALNRPAELDEAIDRIKVDIPDAAVAIEDATKHISAGLAKIGELDLADRSYIGQLQLIVVGGHDNTLSIAQGRGDDDSRKSTARSWIFGTLGFVIQTIGLLGSLASISPFIMPNEQLDAVMVQFQAAAKALQKFF